MSAGCVPARTNLLYRDHQALAAVDPATREGAGLARLSRVRMTLLRQAGLAGSGGVSAGRCAEHAAILAAELGGVVVADGVGDAGDVVGIGGEPGAGLVEAQAFW